MHRRIGIVAAILLLLSFESVFAEFGVGDRVFAYWEESEGYFVGTIVETDSTIKGGGFLVVYDDGDQAVVPYARIKPLDVQAGSKVFAKWSDGKLYPGTVKRIIGNAIFIHFDDGDEGWTAWSGIAIK
jgi:hypothetical protein